MEWKKSLQVYQIFVRKFFAVFVVNFSSLGPGECLLYAEIVNDLFYLEPFSEAFQNLLWKKAADRMYQSPLAFPGEIDQCHYPLPLVRFYYEQEQILFSEGCAGQAWIVPEQVDAVWQ